MTPEQLQRLERLEQEIQAIKRSATIPRDIQTALEERLNFLNHIGTGSATTQTIQLTGNPQDISVPAQPSGTLKVIHNGVIRELLYK